MIAFASTLQSASFYATLRLDTQVPWTAAVRHRFCQDLAVGTLPAVAMRRYLVQDYTFLDSFIALLGRAIGAAPDLAARLTLSRFLAIITSEENDYFLRAFAALDVPERDWRTPDLLPATLGFQTLMLEAGETGEYLSMLAVLTVAESLYADWATTAKAVAEQAALPFYAWEWITLHANPDFLAFVAWLTAQLDATAQASAVGRDRAAAFFRRAVELELAFFEAAYACE